MEKIKINTEYIKLDQFLKWAGIVESGSDAKAIVQEGQVRVNENIEIQRGKKLRPGDKIYVLGKEFEIE